MIYDVITIGGGISGLSASVDIANTGANLLLLEGGSRLGGRILSQCLGDSFIELGAEFIHNEKSEIFNYTNQLKIPSYHVTGTGLYHSRDAGFQELHSGASHLVDHFLTSAKPRQQDRSIADALDDFFSPELSARDQSRVKNWIEAYHAVDIHKASFNFIAAGPEEDSLVKLQAPLSTMIEELGRGLNIQTNCIVRRIDWQDDTIKVSTNEKCFLAKKVLLTVPIPVLKENAISFVPEFPKKAALSCFNMGLVEKVQIVLKENPFDLELTFLYSEEELFNYWIATRHSNYFILTAWVAGKRALQLQDSSDEKIKEIATHCLKRLSGNPKLEKNIHRVFYHGWNRDPKFRGAYSYLAPGGAEGPKLLAHPVSKKLYFAGEATAQDNQIATIHGAFDSGKRAAREILIDLK